MEKIKIFVITSLIMMFLGTIVWYLISSQPPEKNTYVIYHDLKEDGVSKEKIRKLGLLTVENVIQDTLIQFAKDKIKEASRDECTLSYSSYSDANSVCCINVLDTSEYEATPVGRVVNVDEHEKDTYSQSVRPLVSDILETAATKINESETELRSLLKTNLEANGVTVNNINVDIHNPTKIGGVVSSETKTYTAVFKVPNTYYEEACDPNLESAYQNMLKAAEDFGCPDLICKDIIDPSYCTGYFACGTGKSNYACDINNVNYRRALAFHPECIPVNFSMSVSGAGNILFTNFPLNKKAIKECAKNNGTITCYDTNGNPIDCSVVGLSTKRENNKKVLHLAHELSVTVSYELTSTIHSLVLYKVTSQERIPISVNVNGADYYYILTLTKGQISPALVAQKGAGSCIQSFRVREKILISVTDAAGNELASDEITPSVYYTEDSGQTSCSNKLFVSDNLCVV